MYQVMLVRNQRSARSSEVLRGSGGGGTSSGTSQQFLNMLLSVSRFFFRSGNIEHPGDKLFNTSVEVLPFDVSPTSATCCWTFTVTSTSSGWSGVTDGGVKGQRSSCVCLCAEHPGGEGGSDGRSGEDPPVPAH